MSEKQRLIDLANKRIMHLRFMQEAKTPVGVTPRGGVQFDNSDSIALLEAALAHLSAETVAWQCLRKGPGRFVVTLERVVAEEWARKGWPMRALCEVDPDAPFLSRSPDGDKDPECE